MNPSLSLLNKVRKISTILLNAPTDKKRRTSAAPSEREKSEFSERLKYGCRYLGPNPLLNVRRSTASPAKMHSARRRGFLTGAHASLRSDASVNASAAPENYESTKTPGSCGACAATYSLATRFMPSRNGVT